MPQPGMAHAQAFFAQIDVAARTETTYRHALKRLAEYLASDQAELPNLDASAAVPVTLLREDSLAQFRHWLRSRRGYSRRTEATYLAGAVRFVEWLDANSLLPAGLTSSRMRLVLKDARGRRRVGYKTQPIQEAVPLLIQYYDRLALPTGESPRARRGRLSLLRNRAMLHALFASGMRAQELASLRRSDCADGQADKLLITGKGEKERVVMLSPDAQRAIQAYLAARDQERRGGGPQRAAAGRGDPLFVRHDRDQAAPITTKTIWQVVHQAVRALGLEANISPHDFRRYIATTLLSEGMPLESVQAFLGHESIVTTRTVYARTWSEVLEDQVKTYRPTVAEAAKRARSRGVVALPEESRPRPDEQGRGGQP